MRLDPIVTRLKTTCPALRQVLPALSGATPAAYPAAYVMQTAEKPIDVDLAGRWVRIEARFAVEVMLKHAAQAATGGPAQDQLETLREALLAALVGWRASADFAPIEFTGGRLLGFEAGLAVWRDEFVCHFTRSTLTGD